MISSPEKGSSLLPYLKANLSFTIFSNCDNVKISKIGGVVYGVQQKDTNCQIICTRYEKWKIQYVP
jgi:hypothetical protein